MILKTKTQFKMFRCLVKMSRTVKMFGLSLNFEFGLFHLTLCFDSSISRAFLLQKYVHKTNRKQSLANIFIKMATSNKQDVSMFIQDVQNLANIWFK